MTSRQHPLSLCRIHPPSSTSKLAYYEQSVVAILML
jgi:hypothetical protein